MYHLRNNFFPYAAKIEHIFFFGAELKHAKMWAHLKFNSNKIEIIQDIKPVVYNAVIKPVQHIKIKASLNSLFIHDTYTKNFLL